MTIGSAVVPILEECRIRRARHLGVIAAVRIDDIVGIHFVRRGETAITWSAHTKTGETLEELGGGAEAAFFSAPTSVADVTFVCTRASRDGLEELVFERSVHLAVEATGRVTEVVSARPTSDARWLDRAMHLESAVARSPSMLLPYVESTDLLPQAVVPLDTAVVALTGGTGVLTMLQGWPEMFTLCHHWQPDDPVAHLGPLVGLVEAIDDLGNRYLGRSGGSRLGVDPTDSTAGVSMFWPRLDPEARRLTFEAGMPEDPLLVMTAPLPGA